LLLRNALGQHAAQQQSPSLRRVHGVVAACCMLHDCTPPPVRLLARLYTLTFSVACVPCWLVSFWCVSVAELEMKYGKEEEKLCLL
jgi:hypothetical protein